MGNEHTSFDELSARMAETPFYAWSGLELVRAARGEADVAFDAGPDHVNVQGLVHGGMLATLADTAMGLAVRTELEPGGRHVTVQLDVRFLRPAPQGRIVARGRAVRVGSRIAVAEADVVDGDGRLLARASSTIAVGERRT